MTVQWIDPNNIGFKKTDFNNSDQRNITEGGAAGNLPYNPQWKGSQDSQFTLDIPTPDSLLRWQILNFKEHGCNLDFEGFTPGVTFTGAGRNVSGTDLSVSTSLYFSAGWNLNDLAKLTLSARPCFEFDYYLPQNSGLLVLGLNALNVGLNDVLGLFDASYQASYYQNFNLGLPGGIELVNDAFGIFQVSDDCDVYHRLNLSKRFYNPKDKTNWIVEAYAKKSGRSPFSAYGATVYGPSGFNFTTEYTGYFGKPKWDMYLGYNLNFAKKEDEISDENVWGGNIAMYINNLLGSPVSYGLSAKLAIQRLYLFSTYDKDLDTGDRVEHRHCIDFSFAGSVSMINQPVNQPEVIAYEWTSPPKTLSNLFDWDPAGAPKQKKTTDEFEGPEWKVSNGQLIDGTVATANDNGRSGVVVILSDGSTYNSNVSLFLKRVDIYRMDGRPNSTPVYSKVYPNNTVIQPKGAATDATFQFSVKDEPGNGYVHYKCVYQVEAAAGDLGGLTKDDIDPDKTKATIVGQLKRN